MWGVILRFTYPHWKSEKKFSFMYEGKKCRGKKEPVLEIFSHFYVVTDCFILLKCCSHYETQPSTFGSLECFCAEKDANVLHHS